MLVVEADLITAGVDDGFFPQEFKGLKLKTVLAGVLCVGRIPKSVRIDTITVDGDDGTAKAEALVEWLERDLNVEAVDTLFLDGVTVAGFNYVDPLELHNNLRVPVAVIFKTELKLDRIRKALMNHFTDWRRRFDLIKDNYTKSCEVVTLKRKLRITPYGLGLNETARIVVRLQHLSAIPEPLRVADLVASELTKGTKLLEVLKSRASR
ncbi:MAG: DUF99 family protein [Thermofilum sp.]